MDLKFGEIGSMLRIFAKGKIKKEIDHIMGKLGKAVKG